MAEIFPFRAIRFDDEKFPTLSKVTCPPYDVIQVPEYHRLVERHPNNIVRVELPLAHGKGDRYAVAAAFWKQWQARRVLQTDDAPAYYGYEQRFSVNGENFARRGFFAALRIEPPGEGRIRPHERTFPKHKEDRLKLMRATHANVSPIFGIFFDKQKKAAALLEERMAAKAAVTSRDDKGVTHKLWIWSDPEAIKTLGGVLKNEDVLIADGHHRYETSWNYSRERLAKEKRASSRSAHRFVMTFLCPLADPGLVIQPTHRAVRQPGTFEDWQKRIEPYFRMEKGDGLASVLLRLRSTKEAAMGLVLEGGRLFWLQPKAKGSALPVVTLHENLLKDVPLENIAYGQDPRDLVENLRRGECQAVFLLPPPDKQAFARICRAGKRLPQKSTYFYPKLATGLVMRSLDGEV